MKRQLIKENNLYNKRNIFLFEKLLKNMNINPKLILEIFNPEQALQTIRKLFTTAKEPDIIKLIRADSRNIHDSLNLVASETDVTKQLGHMTDVITKISNAIKTEPKYANSRIVRYLDSNLPIEKKVELLAIVERGNMSEFEKFMRTVNIEDVATSVTPYEVSKRLSKLELDLLQGGRWWGKPFINRMMAWEKIVLESTEVPVPAELIPFKMAMEYTDFSVGTEAEKLTRFNQKLLEFVLGGEYKTIQNKIIEELKGTYGVRSLPMEILQKELTPEKIIDRLGASHPAIAKIEILKQSLQRYAEQQGVIFKQTYGFWKRLKENYHLELANTPAHLKEQVISNWTRILYVTADYLFQWVFPTRQSKVIGPLNFIYRNASFISGGRFNPARKSMSLPAHYATQVLLGYAIIPYAQDKLEQWMVFQAALKQEIEDVDKLMDGEAEQRIEYYTDADEIADSAAYLGNKALSLWISSGWGIRKAAFLFLPRFGEQEKDPRAAVLASRRSAGKKYGLLVAFEKKLLGLEVSKFDVHFSIDDEEKKKQIQIRIDALKTAIAELKKKVKEEQQDIPDEQIQSLWKQIKELDETIKQAKNQPATTTVNTTTTTQQPATGASTTPPSAKGFGDL